MQARIMFDHRHKKATQTPRWWERGREEEETKLREGHEWRDSSHERWACPPFFFFPSFFFFFFLCTP